MSKVSIVLVAVLGPALRAGVAVLSVTFESP
jgi:hypothetical protein